MKKVIILSVLLGFTFASQAQTFEDAVQFQGYRTGEQPVRQVWRVPSELWGVICQP